MNKNITIQQKTALRHVVMMLLMMLLGVNAAWGQPSEGLYFIANYNNNGYNVETPANNFYLVPAANPQQTNKCDAFYSADYSSEAGDSNQPFLATKKTTKDANSVWRVENVPGETGFYYIIHQQTGRYVIYEPVFSGSDSRRKSMHLKETNTPGDEAKFEITVSKTGYAIRPKLVAAGSGIHCYFNVASANSNNYYGTGSPGYYNGLVGLFSDAGDKNGVWCFEQATIDPPTITNNETVTNTFTITAATGATIYYTTDGTTPTTETTTTGTTSVTFDQTASMTVIKAIAKAASDHFPTIVTTYNIPACERPVIKVSGGTVTITCPKAGADIYYTTNGDPATASSTPYNEPFDKGDATTIRAIATKAGYLVSSEAIFLPPTEVSSSSAITDMNGNYLLTSSFTSSGSVGTSDNPFKGTIDGNLNTLTLSYPLVAYADGAIIKNVILDNDDNDDVTIKGNENGNAGAICCEATGDTRIYNCGVLGGSVEGTNNVGGIVGLLDGRSRVVNCYNYANITSGSNCGGIVGYNNVASTSSNLQTMVMNCMFYGNITGDNAAPIYGGNIIHNKYASADDTGLNNYCYFLYDEEKNPYVKTIAAGNYHGALGAEERYLNRFEFFRMTLNSTRNLAAFYATGDATQKGEIAKWVLDKSIAHYPILKAQDKYPSVVNYDAENAPDSESVGRNHGGKLGKTLTVHIGGVGNNAPDGASIRIRGAIKLERTDKDYDNFNFNYDKVQLPYYNDVGIGNYTGNRVVTGWKITSITGGTPGSFSTDTYDYPSFNFVDRKCTNKDLYSESGRVFAQGAYWEVPDGVTAITIEPYWAKAVYLSDANYDVTYAITISGSGTSATATATKYGVTACGSCPTDYNGQTVYTDLSTAITNLGSNADHTVYDYAVVLMGNYHQAANNALVNDGKPITFMSADLDGDNEPDNTLFYYHNMRRSVSPMRFDFLNIPGIGMVKRTHDATMDPEPGIFCPKGWFEVTNTVFIRFGQFEYAGSSTSGTSSSPQWPKTILAPLILQGGIYEQFVSCTRTNAQNTNYLLIGGNAWFKNFANGCHTAYANKTPKVPINVAGGDYTNFYLTGIYQPNSAEASENAECYIDGGRFTEVAGAGMQQVKGNVTWLINAADITKFFGGGINAAKPITGSISTTISNSYVDEFYGGPKFGDMSAEKNVTTNATDCHFGKYFGAGYGGTAFNRVGYKDDSNVNNSRTWDTWVTDYYGRAYDGTNGGISTDYDYEFILHSDGNQTVARFFVNYASLSLASTRNVTNTLSGCTIGTFYGGGSLGAVNGDVNSTLTDCTVTGNAFGAGFSASVPTVEVWNAGANLDPNPKYNRTANVFNNASVKTPKDNDEYVVYTWSKTHGTNAEPFVKTEDGKYYIHTDESLDGLGSVTGNVTLTINGNTVADEDGNVMKVDGNVYGGGEESGVGGNTTVIVNGGTIGTGTAGSGNVFGAGKGLETDYSAALVKGNSTITMAGGTVKGNIYGGGELSSVGTFTFSTTDTSEPAKIATWTDDTGKATITISGGTIGNSSDYTYDANNTISHTNGGNVFAGSKGSLFQVGTTTATSTLWSKFAKVRNTEITISDNAAIMSNVYGGGEIGSVGYETSTGAVGGTVITISGGTIGTEIKEGTTAKYTFGSVFGGGYGSSIEELIYTPPSGDPITTNPKLHAGIVYGGTKVTMSGDNTHVWASVYGGGEVASVKGNPSTDDADVFTTDITINGGFIGRDKEDANKFVSKAQFGGATMGNVYGGGKGYKNVVRAGQIKGNTKVTINGGTIYHNVYGGGAYATVGDFNYGYTTAETGPYAGIPKVSSVNGLATEKTGFAKITITGGTIGVDGLENGMVFGSSRGDVGEQRDLWLAWVDHTKVEIGSTTAESNEYPLIKGSVYGSGENGHVYSNTDVIVHSGTIGIHRDNDNYNKTRGNVYGGGCGEDIYPNDTQVEGMAGKYEPSAGIVYGTTKVTVDGGIVKHNIYGAGALGSVGITDTNGAITSVGTTTIAISGGTIGHDGNDNGNVYGAARGDVNSTQAGIAQVQTTGVTISGSADVKGSVFGGGEAGIVLGAVTVNMTGGNVTNDVYGGGALANTNTASWGANTWADAEKKSALYTTAVNLTGGKIARNVYGGGLGKIAVGTEGQLGYEPAIEAKVYGNTTVELNKGVDDDTKGCIVLGSIFGCNNLNGTPMGDVKVHIYKTQNNAATRIANAPASGDTPAVEDAKVKDRYDVKAVYGGGNLAAYIPKDLTTGTTNVIIDGCGLTSIQTVYGGGNAASTPATNVTVNGTYEIEEVFGGGNGKDAIGKDAQGNDIPNPGANVGFYDYSAVEATYPTKEDRQKTEFKEKYVYGSGKASVNIFGGTIHRVFGGSNTKGNVRQTAVTMLEEVGGCDFCVDEAYGGGKSAPMDAEAKLLMACIPGLTAAYGGAEAADVRGNVTLTITNGTFDRVFGGNNLSGTISGSITVNIEEVGCRPIIIGELYGGGNQAGYSVYGYNSDDTPKESGTRLYDDPQVNVKSFTSIGSIFGGGYGSGATMVGNPTVSINETYGRYYNADVSVVGENAKTSGNYPIPSHAKGKIGAINNVFGGGNAAKVIGNTTVNIGTTVGDISYEEVEVETGVTIVTDYYIRSDAGATEGSYTYVVPSVAAGTCDTAGKAVAGKTYYRKVEILGADIRGNVYGGGNNAEVTGNTNVNIGKKSE